MRSFLFAIVCVLAGMAGLGGCEQHHASRQPVTNLVPSTAIVQAHYREDRPQAAQVLPASDAGYDIPRYDRFVYAPIYGDLSYIYTWDYQNIGIRNSGGSGYRYRYIYQTLP